MNINMFLFELKEPDIIFFLLSLAVIVLIGLIYFLIPVFKRKQLRQQRENFKQRESAFRSNIITEDEAKAQEEIKVEESKEENVVEEVKEETVETSSEEVIADDAKEIVEDEVLEETSTEGNNKEIIQESIDEVK